MSKRLVFLYYTDGAAEPDKIPASWQWIAPSTNKYAEQFKTDGLYYVFRRLIELGALDEVLIVTESNRSPGVIATPEPGMSSVVVPHISCLDKVLRSNDLIFTRGGFRGWHDWLRAKQASGYWMWLYAANTGRQRWPWWDLILEDTHDWSGIGTTDARGRHHTDYRKPVNPDFFFAPEEPDFDYEYDIMIGASNITDKKGQWRAVKALQTFKQMYGYSPRCVMPGAPRRGAKTTKMLETLKNGSLDVATPGVLNRSELGNVMRKTRVFLHAGASGQNDRGPLEAMACGCRIVLNAPQYHHPLIAATGSPNLAIDCSRREFLASKLKECLAPKANSADELARRLNFHDRTHGVERVVIPDFQKMLKFFADNPQRTSEGKRRMRHEL